MIAGEMSPLHHEVKVIKGWDLGHLPEKGFDYGMFRIIQKEHDMGQF